MVDDGSGTVVTQGSVPRILIRVEPEALGIRVPLRDDDTEVRRSRPTQLLFRGGALGSRLASGTEQGYGERSGENHVAAGAEGDHRPRHPPRPLVGQPPSRPVIDSIRLFHACRVTGGVAPRIPRNAVETGQKQGE